MARVSISRSQLQSTIGNHIRNNKESIIDGAVQSGLINPEEAGQKFVEVLKASIASSGLSAEAVAALSDVSCSGATYLGDGNFAVSISFDSDLFRLSLIPEYYGGIENIAALLNNGAGPMKPVYGEWPGHGLTWSRTVIPGAHFMESAVGVFMASYAAQYGVTGIDITLGS